MRVKETLQLAIRAVLYIIILPIYVSVRVMTR